jgi:signal transduction histidine kinase
LGLFAAGLPARLAQLRQQYRGHISAELRWNQAGEVVLSPWSGEAAARAGILEGDILVAVNGISVRREPGLPAAEALPAGAAGTQVTLSVRTGSRPLRQYTIIRGGMNGSALAQLGLTGEFVAGYAMAAEVAFALAFCAIALAIVWRRSGDWLAMLISLTLIMVFVGAIASPVVALYNSQPVWQARLDPWFATALAAILAFFYLFPDGRFVPWWTKVLVAIFVAWTLAALVFPSLYPWRMPSLRYFLVIFGWLGTGVYAQVSRYRGHAGPIQRQQTKWVVFGAGAATLGLLGQFWQLLWLQQPGLPNLVVNLAVYPASRLLELFLPFSIGIAILRYRLWDVDLFVNRTLVYGALTAGTMGVYVLVVGVLGTLLRAGSSPTIAFLATGVVALLFQPLRDRLQHAVNRLMYGERDEPYRVLSRLGQRLEATLAPEAVLPTIVETVAQALGVPYVEIALQRNGIFETAAAYGALPAGREAEGEGITLPLVYQAETVGQMVLAARAPGEPFTPPDRRLLDDLARQAGVAAHAVRLTADLQRSRERLVSAREEERRRLRRDLHDGLGPSLASLTLQLDAARNLLARDPAATGALLAELKTQTQAAIADIRRLVYALRPPALDDLGLVSALRQHAAQYSQRDGLAVSVEAPEQPLSLPAAVEVAAYRIALEALTNVVRHAHARTCFVRLSLFHDTLHLEISDDGVGLPPDRRAGVGLSAMRERAAELGGTCDVGPNEGGGTRVVARLPISKE